MKTRRKSAPTSKAPPVMLGARWQWRHAAVLPALALLVALAYSNSFGTQFVLDNKGLLLDPRIRVANSDNVDLIFHHTYWWPSGETGLYRPFTTLSYLFNYAVLGNATDPAGYHGLNLLLHLANVWVAYAIAWVLTRRFWPSFFIAALWAMHPVATESVTNIVGRADLLAGIAVLAGLLLYVKYDSGALWFGGLIALTAIGVFSKESAVMILPIAALYNALVWRRRAWIGCMAMMVPIAVMLAQRSAVLAASPLAEFPFTDNPIGGASGWIGRMTAMKILPSYIWQAIWPVHLSCDYSFNQIPLARGDAADWLICGAVLVAAIGAFFLIRANRVAFFFLSFAFLNFLPVSNLLFAIGTIRADRLLYLPSLGLLGCLVLGIYAIARVPRLTIVPPILLGLLVAGFALRTWLRNVDWRSEMAIATVDLRVSPNSFKLHRLLASALFEADPSHANLDGAIVEQEKALAILEAAPPALRPADAYRMAGYYDLLKSRRSPSPELSIKAIQSLERAVSLDAKDAQAWLLLSVAYLESGDADKADAPATQAVSLNPLNAQAYRQLSAVLVTRNQREPAAVAQMLEDAITALNQGQWAKAAELSDQVIAVEAHPTAYFVSAAANLRSGNVEIAEQQAREAIRLDSEDKIPEARYLLGLVFLRKQEWAQAAELLRVYVAAAPAAADAGIARERLRDAERSARK